MFIEFDEDDDDDDDDDTDDEEADDEEDEDYEEKWRGKQRKHTFRGVLEIHFLWCIISEEILFLSP